MSDIQRYSIESCGILEITQVSWGGWVDYDDHKADKREAVIQAFMAGQAREGIDPSYSDAKNYEAKLREGE